MFTIPPWNLKCLLFPLKCSPFPLPRSFSLLDKPSLAFLSPVFILMVSPLISTFVKLRLKGSCFEWELFSQNSFVKILATLATNSNENLHLNWSRSPTCFSKKIDFNVGSTYLLSSEHGFRFYIQFQFHFHIYIVSILDFQLFWVICLL